MPTTVGSPKTVFTFIAITLLTFTYFYTSRKASLSSMESNYEAPLLNSDLPEDERVHHSYIVYLHPGYTMNQHAKNLQRNQSSFVNHIYDFIKDQVVYVGRPIDDRLLRVLRSDPGVQKVECEPIPMPDDF